MQLMFPGSGYKEAAKLPHSLLHGITYSVHRKHTVYEENKLMNTLERGFFDLLLNTAILCLMSYKIYNIHKRNYCTNFKFTFEKSYSRQGGAFSFLCFLRFLLKVTVLAH